MQAHYTKTIVFGSKRIFGSGEFEVDTDQYPWIHIQNYGYGSPLNFRFWRILQMQVSMFMSKFFVN
jgi:hypothetical protein